MDKINVEMKRYGFKEGKDFTGLMPKVMEIMGDDYCTGLSEEVVSIFDPTANGVDTMKVVSSQLVAEK